MEVDGWGIFRPSGDARRAGVGVIGFEDRTDRGLDMFVTPLPAVTVAIDFGAGRVDVAGGPGTHARSLDGIVAGLAPGWARITGTEVACVELRIDPVAAYPLLGVAPLDLDGEVIGLEDLWGTRPAFRLREQLAAAADWDERFALTDAFLAVRHRQRRTVDPEVAHCWERILASGGHALVGDLAAACGWTRKRLWSRFRAQIGITPKRAAMLVRFDAAARRLGVGDSPAQVAAACGHADQPQLHRDVMAFTGRTPAALAGDRLFSSRDGAWEGVGTFVQDRDGAAV